MNSVELERCKNCKKLYTEHWSIKPGEHPVENYWPWCTQYGFQRSSKAAYEQMNPMELCEWIENEQEHKHRNLQEL